MRQLKIIKSITNRNIGSLDKFLQDISKEELISPEQEVKLAQRIREGDQDALEKLVRSNLRFVISVAKQYQNQGLSLPDLINEGNIGLIKAAKRFDETRGFKFISFAVWWIRQSILQALAEKSRIVRLPLNQVGAINKIKKAASHLEQQYERTPSIEELADEMDISSDKIKEVSHIGMKPVSMDAPLVQDEDMNLIDIYVDEEARKTDDIVMQESLSRDIASSLSILTERERSIINQFFGIGLSHGMTLEEIAIDQNLTRERVRQIKERALKRLRQSKECQKLSMYL
ncbi:MAG TPA: RNA polymerase sigma factor RpoD/SigA [Candidatus Onthomorpha intestinigallinarum]|uniref:RNA polymerase sigma factor RpoD/SigA n=1 Tax=Candidatus Onthomorpha intestinigallinarum TaxID=2840880 RepID=A0A9D1UI71_9BACT|nr:RNA polymerase sigma factor RpoD/SigA [Candidatus Onthomorpha intestinigallinarum]